MSKQILLADDSITIQKVIALTFAGEDYKITAVDNGADAVAKASEIKPDIILADVMMPQKNGYDVCRTIKGDPALSSVPVLLLAGTFEPFDEDEAKKAGADGYIIKPFESQALIQKVKDLISGSIEKPAEQPKPVVAVAPAPDVAEPIPPAAPAVPEPTLAVPPLIAAPAPAPAPQPEATGEEDFWGTMMEELEEKAPSAKATAPAAEEASSEEVWDMGEFEEETAPAAEEKEEDIWESFAFEEEEEKGEEVMEAPVFEEASVEEELTFVSEEIPIGEGLTPPVEEIKEEAPVGQEVEAVQVEAVEPMVFEEVPVAEPEEEPIEIVEEEEIPVAVEETIPMVEPEWAAAAPEAREIQEEAFTPETVEMEGAAVSAPEPVAAPVVSSPALAQTGTSEEALRAALSQASREVIEKIVWEVVPDLAEMLIKEEIKRLQGK